MRTIQVPNKEQVSEGSQAIFDNLEKQIGKVPNLYATMGYSAVSLGAHLQYSQALAKGVFNAKEREAIFLAVSEVNGCEYCKAAHTAIAKMNGFTEEETIQLRSGNHSDEKLRTITRLAASITENRGKADSESVENFFNLGYNEEALIDLISLVSEITFSNYTHRLTDVPIDFPRAKELAEAV